MNVYYSEMNSKKPSVEFTSAISQLKLLKAQLENAVNDNTKTASDFKDELKRFFNLKNVAGKVSYDKLTPLQLGGADSKKQYVQLGGKLELQNNSEERLLNIMNQNINIMSSHMRKLGW